MPLGHALYSDRSEIAAADADARARSADARFVARSSRRRRASYRESLGIDATAYRLIHGEADRLPGLVVDRYGDYLVLQALVQGIDRLLPDLTRLLVERLKPAGILARNDPRVRLLEGLEQTSRCCTGRASAASRCARAGSATWSIRTTGRRPGCFSTSERIASPRPRYARGRALDAFSYNGGFALALSPVCDEVIAVDISEDAVARIAANAAQNRHHQRAARGP